MYINADVQAHKDLSLEQELFDLLESRGLTGEIPEENPEGLKIITRPGYKIYGNDGQDSFDCNCDCDDNGYCSVCNEGNCDCDYNCDCPEWDPNCF